MHVLAHLRRLSAARWSYDTKVARQRQNTKRFAIERLYAKHCSQCCVHNSSYLKNIQQTTLDSGLVHTSFTTRNANKSCDTEYVLASYTDYLAGLRRRLKQIKYMSKRVCCMRSHEDNQRTKQPHFHFYLPVGASLRSRR